MRIGFCLLALIAPLWAESSIYFDGQNGEAHGTLKKQRTSVGQMRLEFRIHDFDATPVNEGRLIVVCNQIFYRGGSSPLLYHTNWLTSNGQWGAVSLAGRTDVIIRVQHRLDEGITEYEMWNADGTGYARGTSPGRTETKSCDDSELWFGAVGEKLFARFGMAYFRWFDTLSPTGSSPSDGPEGAFVAYEFEGAATDTAGNATPAVPKSGTAYKPTVIYPPLVSAGDDRTIRRNDVIQLSGGGGGTGTTWKWEQLRGPVPVQIVQADRRETTAIGASQPGTYEFRLTVVDRNQRSASGTVRVGVVLENDQGMVLVDDPNAAFVLGPMLRHGASPWKWYDDTRLSMGQLWALEYPKLPGLEDRPGEVTLTKGSTSVVGTGTRFIDDFLQPLTPGTGTITVTAGSTQVTGQGTNFLTTFLSDPRPGGLVLLQGAMARVDGAPVALAARQSILIQDENSRLHAYRIARVVNATTFELETPYTGPEMSASVPFQIANDRPGLLVVTDAGRNRWAFQPVVATATELTLSRQFSGEAGAGLTYATGVTLPGGDLLVSHQRREDDTSSRSRRRSAEVGYRMFGLGAVLSDTEVSMYTPYPLETATGVSFGRASEDDSNYWTEGLNYYDSILVHYQNYYRTGNDIYRDYARSLADSWWTFFDSGRIDPTGIAPRRVSLAGLILRAMDGRPELWPWITSYVDFHFQLWLGVRRNNDQLYFGVREGGYMLYYAALLAKAHPDPAVRASYLAKATDISIHYFGRLQQADGRWTWIDDLWKGMGEQPFHVGVLLEGLIATHRLTQNGEILQVIKKSVDHLIAIQQPAPCRSPVYSIYNDDGPSGLICKTAADRPTPDELMDSRAGNNTIVQALGYLWVQTGDPQYRQMGDDMFAATFGAGQGPGSDAWKGRADTTPKQYGQSFRSSGAYLPYRLYSVGGPAVPGN